MGRMGETFAEAAVVDAYVYRPPYPDALYRRLTEIAPATHHALDIGCGPGKIARPLAARFDRVTAVDPSANMLALARSLSGGDAPNIEWIEGFAETAPLDGHRFDLTVAAASIHWMDHALLFPRLRTLAAEGHVLAVVEGDDAHNPPWQAEWVAFLTRWLPIATGRPYDQVGHQAFFGNYRDHVEVEGDEVFAAPFSQKVAAFVACQHSRDSFAPSRLGERMAEFDAELTELLAPFAQDGQLHFEVRTRLTWARVG
jgi:SAM-dependent methyltransferase